MQAYNKLLDTEKMSAMIETNRPPVYIENQSSLDTFMFIHNGNPSVNLFVSFHSIGKGGPSEFANVDADHEFDEDINVEEDERDEGDEDVYEDEDNEEDDVDMYEDEDDDDIDGSCCGSTLDPTIDDSEGSGEDYDYNKWDGLIVDEYGIGHVKEEVVNDTQQTVDSPKEFTSLLASCTLSCNQNVL